MKAKSRRRLLISSVAMLLVAMLALGTATFAWFTSSTTATTQGLAVHTTKASKLQISKATGDWSTTINYNTGDLLLLPTSTINGSNWWKATAAKSTEFTANSAGYISASNGTNDKYYFADQLNIRNGAATGDASIENVQIKMTWPSNEYDTSYLRVALVPAAERGADKSLKTGATFTDGIWAKDTTGYKPVNASGAENDSNITPKAGPTTNTAIITLDGALAPGNEVYYNLYVWFEGQDTDCFDNNAGAAIPDVKFEVTGDTVRSN